MVRWGVSRPPFVASIWRAKLDLQVHADASNFEEGVTKEDAYEQVLLQAEGLFYDQRNWVCSLASPEMPNEKALLLTGRRFGKRLTTRFPLHEGGNVLMHEWQQSLQRGVPAMACVPVASSA